MDIFYLHGFASSARSSKAGYLAGRLAEHGLALHAPDFNAPDFATLTVTRMIAQVTRAIDQRPGRHPRGHDDVVLIGSSLGAFVAVQSALQRPDRVTRMVLLAPALDLKDFGADRAEEWRSTNWLPVFHYAFGRTVQVHYELYADAGRYDSLDALVDMPILVFQGRRDTAVDATTVQQWAQARPNVELHMLDDDHQLIASPDYIWSEMKRFLKL